MRYGLFSSRARVLAFGVATAFFVLAPSVGWTDDLDAPPKIDLTKANYQPHYPASASGKNEHGDVTLAVYIEASGKPSKVNVATSSGFDDLDQAAVAAVQGWQFVPGAKNGAPIPAWTKIVIHFQVSDAVQHPNGDNEVYAATDDGDRIICKKNVAATGSHIPPPTVCLSKREWDKSTNAAERDVRHAISSSDKVINH